MTRAGCRAGVLTSLAIAALAFDIGQSWRFGVAMVLVAAFWLVVALGRPS